MPVDTGIGPWTVGKHLTSILIAPVTVAGTTTISPGGTTWTVGTPIECVGVVRRVQHQMRVQTADIRPITQPMENQVPISYGHTMQIVNLRVSNNTTPGNTLAFMIATTFYLQVQFNDSLEQYNGYFAITGFESGFDGNAEQVQSLDLAPVAITTGPQMIRTFITAGAVLKPPP